MCQYVPNKKSVGAMYRKKWAPFKARAVCDGNAVTIQLLSASVNGRWSKKYPTLMTNNEVDTIAAACANATFRFSFRRDGKANSKTTPRIASGATATIENFISGASPVAPPSHNARRNEGPETYTWNA